MTSRKPLEIDEYQRVSIQWKLFVGLLIFLITVGVAAGAAYDQLVTRQEANTTTITALQSQITADHEVQASMAIQIALIQQSIQDIEKSQAETQKSLATIAQAQK